MFPNIYGKLLGCHWHFSLQTAFVNFSCNYLVFSLRSLLRPYKLNLCWFFFHKKKRIIMNKVNICCVKTLPSVIDVLVWTGNWVLFLYAHSLPLDHSKQGSFFYLKPDLIKEPSSWSVSDTTTMLTAFLWGSVFNLKNITQTQISYSWDQFNGYFHFACLEGCKKHIQCAIYSGQWRIALPMQFAQKSWHLLNIT